MQKKFGIVVVAAIQEVARIDTKMTRPGVRKGSRRHLKRRSAPVATIAA